MKFITTIAAFLLAVTAEAGGKKGWGGDYPPIPSSMTVEEAAKKCGDQAQLSCCNRAIRAGDKTDVGGGLLKNALGGGSGDHGVEIFDQCSHLGIQIPIIAVAVQNILNDECKQNVACCQTNPGSASNDLIGVELACIALGNLL